MHIIGYRHETAHQLSQDASMATSIECFKQHPELAVGPKGERYLARKAIGKGKGKGKKNAASNVGYNSDSDSEDGVCDSPEGGRE
ncbi:hypothetical protein K3495_g5188 [Podosphaera aphanis]|nr:hypothetical protein K3495_g5188 [Podosphaera aphanis]